jgi:hypothetical protein
VGSYHGAVELLTSVGGAIGQVNVSLHTRPSPHGPRNPDWCGRCTGPDAVMTAAFRARQLQIRLRDGRTGQIIVERSQRPVTGAVWIAPVTGSGPCPFDEPPAPLSREFFGR